MTPDNPYQSPAASDTGPERPPRGACPWCGLVALSWWQKQALLPTALVRCRSCGGVIRLSWKHFWRWSVLMPAAALPLSFVPFVVIVAFEAAIDRQQPPQWLMASLLIGYYVILIIALIMLTAYGQRNMRLVKVRMETPAQEAAS